MAGRYMAVNKLILVTFERAFLSPRRKRAQQFVFLYYRASVLFSLQNKSQLEIFNSKIATQKRLHDKR